MTQAKEGAGELLVIGTLLLSVHHHPVLERPHAEPIEHLLHTLQIGVLLSRALTEPSKAHLHGKKCMPGFVEERRAVDVLSARDQPLFGEEVALGT